MALVFLPPQGISDVAPNTTMVETRQGTSDNSKVTFRLSDNVLEDDVPEDESAPKQGAVNDTGKKSVAGLKVSETPEVEAKAGMPRYPPVIQKRNSDAFRRALLEYNEYLKLEQQYDDKIVEARKRIAEEVAPLQLIDVLKRCEILDKSAALQVGARLAEMHNDKRMLALANKINGGIFVNYATQALKLFEQAKTRVLRQRAGLLYSEANDSKTVVLAFYTQPEDLLLMLARLSRDPDKALYVSNQAVNDDAFELILANFICLQYDESLQITAIPAMPENRVAIEDTLAMFLTTNTNTPANEEPVYDLSSQISKKPSKLYMPALKQLLALTEVYRVDNRFNVEEAYLSVVEDVLSDTSTTATPTQISAWEQLAEVETNLLQHSQFRLFPSMTTVIESWQDNSLNNNARFPREYLSHVRAFLSISKNARAQGKQIAIEKLLPRGTQTQQQAKEGKWFLLQNFTGPDDLADVRISDQNEAAELSDRVAELRATYKDNLLVQLEKQDVALSNLVEARNGDPSRFRQLQTEVLEINTQIEIIRSDWRKVERAFRELIAGEYERPQLGLMKGNANEMMAQPVNEASGSADMARPIYQKWLKDSEREELGIALWQRPTAKTGVAQPVVQEATGPFNASTANPATITLSNEDIQAAADAYKTATTTVKAESDKRKAEIKQALLTSFTLAHKKFQEIRKHAKELADSDGAFTHLQESDNCFVESVQAYNSAADDSTSEEQLLAVKNIMGLSDSCLDGYLVSVKAQLDERTKQLGTPEQRRIYLQQKEANESLKVLKHAIEETRAFLNKPNAFAPPQTNQKILQSMEANRQAVELLLTSFLAPGMSEDTAKDINVKCRSLRDTVVKQFLDLKNATDDDPVLSALQLQMAQSIKLSSAELEAARIRAQQSALVAQREAAIFKQKQQLQQGVIHRAELESSRLRSILAPSNPLLLAEQVVGQKHLDALEQACTSVEASLQTNNQFGELDSALETLRKKRQEVISFKFDTMLSQYQAVLQRSQAVENKAVALLESRRKPAARPPNLPRVHQVPVEEPEDDDDEGDEGETTDLEDDS